MRALLVVFLVGCNQPSAEQACTSYSQEICDKLMTCSAADFQKRWADLPGCEARYQLACKDALAAPGTATSPSREQHCGDEIASETCGDFLDNVDPPADCRAPSGPRAFGAPCAFAGQCASGFCAISSTTLCGACTPMPNAGDSCADQGCGPDMNCVASTSTCQVPIADGGTCSRDLPCKQGDSCVGGTCVMDGTAVGAMCDPMLTTAPACNAADGLTCDRSTHLCVTQPLAAAGQTCGLVNSVAVACAAGADCVRPTGSATGTCIAPAPDGSACDAAGPFCTFPAKCVSGTCQLAGSMSC